MTEQDKNIAIPITDEDKCLISRYMGWPLVQKQDGYTGQYYISVALDANAASLCAAEMQKRGEWGNFLRYANTSSAIGGMFPEQFIALLFNAENFFNAMSEWLKEGK